MDFAVKLKTSHQNLKKQRIPAVKPREYALFVKENLTEAVKSIREKVNQSKFDMILFSPACASFDQYNNFEERGRHFTELVNSFFV